MGREIIHNRAEIRKTLPVAVFVLTLLFSVATVTQLFNVVRANPYSQAVYKGEISSPSKPTITISSPKNNTFCNANSLSIILNVSIIETINENYQEFISRVYYKSDWLQGDTYVYEYYNPDPNYIRPPITEFYYRLNLTGIPEGKHNITFYAIEAGYYYPSLFEYYGFSANGSSVVSFTIDTNPPSVSVLSVENRIFDTSYVPLIFIMTEPTSQISYVLDGQENVTIYGNATLSGLSVGAHNVTVYAWDSVGNAGASETINFSVEMPEPFPATLVAAAAVSVVAIVACLLVYFRKRNH